MASPESTSATANALTPSVSVPTTTETPTLGTEWRQYEKTFPAMAKSRIGQVSLECRSSKVTMSLLKLLDGGPTADEIAEEAYRIYLGRGAEHGQDVNDWLEAERRLGSSRSRR